jgi:hypothetical protein
MYAAGTTGVLDCDCEGRRENAAGGGPKLRHPGPVYPAWHGVSTGGSSLFRDILHPGFLRVGLIVNGPVLAGPFWKENFRLKRLPPIALPEPDLSIRSSVNTARLSLLIRTRHLITGLGWLQYNQSVARFSEIGIVPFSHRPPRLSVSPCLGQPAPTLCSASLTSLLPALSAPAVPPPLSNTLS